MTVIAEPIKKRPYMIIHLDCFNSDIFDNQSQRTVYMTLKQFADSNNQCFPGVKKIAKVALLSKRAVQKALRALKKKFLINIEERFRSDGSQTSNLYTIYDTPGLWTADNAKNTKTAENSKDVENTENANNETETVKIIEQCEDDTLISMMKARGYTVFKNDDVPAELQDKFILNSASDNTIIAQAQDESIEENNITEIEETAEVIPEDVVVQENESVFNNTMPEKENPTIGKKLVSKLKNITRKEKAPTSKPTKATDVSTSNNHLINNDYTTQTAESQALETYSLDWIKDYFGYDAMIDKYPEYQKNIDSVMNILHTTLNTTNKIIRIKGDKKPSMVVKSKLLKLKDEDIIYAIKTFLSQKLKIKNTTAYMITLLYNAPEQRQLEMENAKQYEIAQKNGQASEPDKTQTAATSSSIPLSRDIYPKNQFNHFMERKTTTEELDKLERQLLGLN